jgi:hypothetical protein
MVLSGKGVVNNSFTWSGARNARPQQVDPQILCNYLWVYLADAIAARCSFQTSRGLLKAVTSTGGLYQL